MEDRLQTAGADAVGALFIFLDLLKCDAEIFSQLFLAHSQHVAPKPDATSNMDVDRIRFLLVFFCHFFLAEFFRLCLFFLAQTKPEATAPTERSTGFEKFSGDYSMSF
jgi:hypothetical protein